MPIAMPLATASTAFTRCSSAARGPSGRCARPDAMPSKGTVIRHLPRAARRYSPCKRPGGSCHRFGHLQEALALGIALAEVRPGRGLGDLAPLGDDGVVHVGDLGA